MVRTPPLSSGILAGTTSGVLTSGTSSKTISGVTYDIAESGVGLTATASGGDSLTAATSSTFTVAAIPTQLVITQVNGGSNPVAGQGFSLVVRAQDASHNSGSVATDTVFSLSLNTGTGTLGGTLTGTIPASADHVTVSGLTYTKAETGVKLDITRTSGDNLANSTSAAFTVDPGPLDHFLVKAPGGGESRLTSTTTRFR